MARGKESGKRRTRRREMEAKKETKWLEKTALECVEGIREKLEAIGLPEGTEDEWGRRKYAEAMEAYRELARGWQNADMMAAALIDALEAAAVVALAEAGGWAGWPKEALARVAPNAPREPAEPDSEGAKKREALEELFKSSIDALMGIRGMHLSRLSPENLRTHLGEYPHDPRKKYTFSEAREEMWWWLSEVYRMNLGEVGWLGSDADWISDGLRFIGKASQVMENIRSDEKALGKLAAEVAAGGALDERPTPEPGMELFERMSNIDRETRMERLVRLGRALGELRAEYDAMPEWAKAADCRR